MRKGFGRFGEVGIVEIHGSGLEFVQKTESGSYKVYEINCTIFNGIE